MSTLANLFDFLDFLRRSGKVDAKVAAQLASSVRQVALTVPEETWDQINLTDGFDIESFLAQFRDLRQQDYAPISLAEYQRRFRRAVHMFLDYLKSEDKDGWMPNLRPGRPRATNIARVRARLDAMFPLEKEGEPMEIVNYPFPIRPNVLARFLLPADLRAHEVERVIAFLRSLPIEDETSAPPPQPEPPAESQAQNESL